ncbi:MAG TPA: ComEC/Rec2 family competence protein, partial [Chloroflexota bacterium]|nr:ComEC/Rec2 family competence protein [Chloroflexota bacterium]
VPLPWVWRRPTLRLGLLMACALALGTGRAESARLHIGPHHVSYYNGRAVTLTGYVNAEPDVRDRGNNYVLQAQRIQVGGRVLLVAGQVEVHTAPGQLFDTGDVLQLTGLLAIPTSSPSIPYRQILANRGIYSEMSFPRGYATGHVSLGLVGLAVTIRQHIETTLGNALPEPEGTFLIAILIGARSAQLGTLAPVLVATGLIHLIAISGLKIAIVAGTVNTFLRRITSRVPTLLLSCCALGSYWLVSGATVAGLRASIMWFLVFIAAYLGRPTFALVSLGAAASGMLAIEPSLLWDTGFEFTTLGTAAIVVLAPISDRLTRRLPSAVAASLATTTAAQIGVLPLQVVSFHLISPVSLLANTMVLPVIPLTMVVGFITVLYPHGPALAVSFALVRLIILVAHWVSHLPFSSVALTQLPVSVTVSYYAGLLLIAVLAARLALAERRPIHGEWVLGLAVAGVSLGTALSVPSAHGNQLRFVSPGAALLTDRGSSILIDGGKSPSALLNGLGAQIVFPQRRIDAVISTDPRAANVSALTQVVQHYDVGAVLDTGVEYPSQTYGRWRAELDSKGIRPIALRPGVTVTAGRVTIQALSPDAVYSDPRDTIGMLLIKDGRLRILYMGGASQKEQLELPFRLPVSANLVVSPVPVNPTLRTALGNPTVIHPSAGRVIALP